MIDGIWTPDVSRLESCHEETVRISRLVSDLENLARFEADNLILRKEDFDLVQLTGKIEKSFEADISARNIHITQTLAVRRINADKDKMEQVLVNLISNALKYTPEGGSIEITSTETPQTVVISVKDSGIGISEEDLRIFSSGSTAPTNPEAVLPEAPVSDWQSSNSLSRLTAGP